MSIILQILSILLNIFIIILETSVFVKMKNKLNILKSYILLQNFLALVISIVYCFYAVNQLLGHGNNPVIIKGLRYTATCGLATAMLVFAVFLAPRLKSGKSRSHTDQFGRLKPKKADLILHYICPIISIVSFLVCERGTVLTNYEWTGYAATPTCTYCAIYILLNAKHSWQEPYGLMVPAKEKRKKIVGILLLIAIPAAFILISYVLYWLNLI